MSARTHLPQGLVTFLFTDIEGSTRLAQLLGPGYRAVLTAHRHLLRRTLSACGGVPLFSEGDSVFVAFSDAAAALVACAEAQRALAAHPWPAPEARPLVRMGLHTGMARPHRGEYATPEVHRAARIAAAAHGGQVLCSAVTAGHAGALTGDTWLLDLGLHRLRGFDDRERLFQLVAPGLPRQFPRPRTVADAPHNLPQAMTSFVGRVAERAELIRLIRNRRLVTVVGPGGAGKTRLAVETAMQSCDEHPDGVWFADLAAVADPELVPVAVAAALGLRPEPGRPVLETIVEFAAGRRLLLVLDTCDAQLSAVTVLASRLLSGGGGARILATSREPFGLPGELVWRIPPLSLRAVPGGAPSEAMELLLDRTAAARGGHRPDEAEQVHLTEVAARLAGLPLALELAAARLRVLSAAELVTRLDEVLAAPVSTQDTPGQRPGAAAGRHATLDATVGWSYRTLPADAARLMRWMSVFAGRVDLDTVEWLTAGNPVGALGVLVDKSLVQAEVAASGTTYRMLDPIRAYAARRRDESGDGEVARHRHAAWVGHAVDRAYLGRDGRPVTVSMFAFDRLADEARAALHWSATAGSARQGLRIAVALDQWWRERGLAREARRWLSRLYEHSVVTREQVPPVELATAYHTHALHALADAERAEALDYIRLAEAAATGTDAPGLITRIRCAHAGYLRNTGATDEAEWACREVIAEAQRQGVPADALSAMYCLAELYWRRGALEEAAELLAAARPLEAARPAERGRRTVDVLLGMVALDRGDLVAAHEHLAAGLRSRVGHGFHSRAREAITAFGVRCALAGDLTTAARLFGAAQCTGTGTGRRPVTEYHRTWASRVRSELGDPAFDAAYAEGSRLSLEQAVTIALAVEHPDLAADSLRFSDAS